MASCRTAIAGLSAVIGAILLLALTWPDLHRPASRVSDQGMGKQQPSRVVLQPAKSASTADTAGQQRTVKRWMLRNDSLRPPAVTIATKGAPTGIDTALEAFTENGQRWPDHIESMIYDTLASVGSEYLMTNILSVACQPTECEILFTTPNQSSIVTDDYLGLTSAFSQLDAHVSTASLGITEIYPGVRGYYVRLGNVPVTDETTEAAPHEAKP